MVGMKGNSWWCMCDLLKPQWVFFLVNGAQTADDLLWLKTTGRFFLCGASALLLLFIVPSALSERTGTNLTALLKWASHCVRTVEWAWQSVCAVRPLQCIHARVHPCMPKSLCRGIVVVLHQQPHVSKKVYVRLLFVCVSTKVPLWSFKGVLLLKSSRKKDRLQSTNCACWISPLQLRECVCGLVVS